MACSSAHSAPIKHNGPGSAATSIAESIVKPSEATGGSGKTRCVAEPYKDAMCWDRAI
ncbi:hypothetical protein B0T17DRAFT_615103 [Bombardia bombarda]|uniref:Uncharacterized protein n=1 Tax=Bombardia bombarda TaxID=252184 RepID=A0AA40C8W2_9PEZI|nr:hypothetical protein B0T17DRAFT_615103 [Bombardia bombarda]